MKLTTHLQVLTSSGYGACLIKHRDNFSHFFLPQNSVTTEQQFRLLEHVIHVMMAREQTNIYRRNCTKRARIQNTRLEYTVQQDAVIQY
jgi:hypothetical protein